MRNLLKPLLPAVAALAFIFGVSAIAARAQDAPNKPAGKGNIAGTVTDKDGKAVEGATVNLIKPRPRNGGGAGGPPPAAPKSAAEHGARHLQQHPTPPPPIATATTDKDGKYEMKDVAAGEYMV